MDDEEEDMSSQPITSPHWGALPNGNFKTDATDEASAQHLPYAPAPSLPRCGDAPLGLEHNAQHCGGSQPLALSHGNRSSPVVSSPAPHSEPMDDRGERPARLDEGGDPRERQEQDEEGGGEGNHGSLALPAECAAVSVEVEIGRKLRQIGDKFNQDHTELRRLREALPVWMRLAAALLGLLFPREAMVPPRAEPR
ncbi:unnamed protein product [Boreogadus saida]